jgi:hypothetical protein
MVGNPIHSLDWSGKHLLVGTNNGITKMYEVVFQDDISINVTCVGEYVNSPSEVSME